jgi:dolichol-phosphate mannosyltransferase
MTQNRPASEPASPQKQLDATQISPAERSANPRISVVVPLCNEGENVMPLADRVFSSLQPLTPALELILVDDGSTDNTWSQILAARKADYRVRALRHPRRSGQSAALWSGLRSARGEILCTLDGDLQNDPADLPRMIDLLKESDLVCGMRMRRQDTGLRKISSRIARWARKMVLRVDFQDTGCNLRAFKRSVLQKVFPFDGLHRFMPVLAHVSGAVVREIPVTHHARERGLSKYGLWNRLGRGILDLAAVAWYRRRQINTVEVVEFEPSKPQSEARPS